MSMNINDILEIAPYSLNKMQKHALLNERLHELTRKHYAQCEAYRKNDGSTRLGH